MTGGQRAMAIRLSLTVRRSVRSVQAALRLFYKRTLGWPICRRNTPRLARRLALAYAGARFRHMLSPCHFTNAIENSINQFHLIKHLMAFINQFGNRMPFLLCQSDGWLSSKSDGHSLG